MGALAVLLLAVAGVPQPALTTAAWTDPEYASTTFTAGKLLPPTNVRCEVVDRILIDGVLQQALHFTWTAPAAPSLPPGGYAITLEGEWGLSPMEGTFVANGPQPELYVPTRDFLLSLGTSVASVRSTLGSWESDPATETPEVFVTSVVVLGVVVDCL